jgi:ABC-type multidrug transport system fused ATPase/permease subunit
MLHEMIKLLNTTGSGLRFLLLLILRCPFDAAMTIVNASFLQHAFDAIAQNDAGRLITVCLTFGVMSLCLFLYNGTIWSIYAPFATRMEGRLRVKLFEKISMFSYERIEVTPQGEWLTRLNTDVQMPFSRSVHLPHAACAIINICVSAVILWRMNPAVFGYVLLFVIPHIYISQLFIARAMPELNKKSLEATAANTGELTALITCADIAALYDGRDYLMKRFEISSLHLLRTNMKIRSRNALSATILPLFGMGGYLVLLIMSGSWIADGHFTFGDLTAAFQYRGGVLAGSLMLINCLISIQASMAGIRRLNETMSEKTEVANG